MTVDSSCHYKLLSHNKVLELAVVWSRKIHQNPEEMHECKLFYHLHLRFSWLWCELMLLNVSLLKSLKYPLLMLRQCLHHWLQHHRGSFTCHATELCRPSLPSAHLDTQTGSKLEYDCRNNSHEWKSKLEIHSRLAFRVHCSWQWVSHLSAVQVRKQPTKVGVTVSFNNCSYQRTWQALNIALQKNEVHLFINSVIEIMISCDTVLAKLQDDTQNCVLFILLSILWFYILEYISVIP